MLRIDLDKTMRDDLKNESEAAEEARAAIRASVERAKELVCEAKLAMRQLETPQDEPPNPAR